MALFFVDFKTALMLVAISHLIGNIGRINFFRHGLEPKIIITFGLPSIVLSFLGASLVGWRIRWWNAIGLVWYVIGDHNDFESNNQYGYSNWNLGFVESLKGK